MLKKEVIMLDKKELEKIKEEIMLCEAYFNDLFKNKKPLLTEIVNNENKNSNMQLLTEVKTNDIPPERNPILDIPRFGSNSIPKYEIFDMEKLQKRLEKIENNL